METNTYKEHIRAFLTQDAFFIVNKRLIEEIGLIETVVLSALIDYHKMIERDGSCYDRFPVKKEWLQRTLNITKHTLNPTLANLVKLGLLSEYELQGVPPTRSYSINYSEIEKIITNSPYSTANKNAKYGKLRCCEWNDKMPNTANSYSNIVVNKKQINKNNNKKTNKEDNSNEVSFSKEKSTSMLELSKKRSLSCDNCSKEEDEEFDRFWVLYDKKIGRDKCKRLWARLKKEDKEKIFEVLPLYIQSTPDKQFRKNPTTYLNPSEKHWLDEIIQQTPQQRTNSNYQKQNDYGNSERNHFRDEEDNRERDYNFTF